MRILTPDNAAFSPSGISSASGTVVWSITTDATAVGNSSSGPTAIYTVPTDGLYALYAFVETYNQVAMAAGSVTAQLDFTGGTAFPWDSGNVDLASPTQIADNKMMATRRCIAGSTVDLTLVVATFAGTSADYSIYIALVRLA